MYRKPLSWTARACAALVLASWLGCGATGAAELETAKAVMKQQEISFYFQSFTTKYSCDGIEGKVKKLLLALGASKDLEVEASGCISVGPTSLPLVKIQLSSPVPATPLELALLDKTRPQRELAAKVRGERPEGTDAGAQFDASWTPVSLSRGKLGLEPGDCELIDELRKKVLPKLGVRIVKDSVQCTPFQLNRSQPRLEVEALVQPPPPDVGAAGSTPAPEADQAPEPEADKAPQ